MGSPGYVYVLVNPAMPGLVKVGRTSRSPEERARELSAGTGIASPFILVYHEHFLDADDAEQRLHTTLELEGCRHSPNREFFQIDVPSVIKAFAHLPGKALPSSSTQINSGDELLLGEENDELSDLTFGDVHNDDLAYDIWREGYLTYAGVGDRIEDPKEAMELFKKAAKLGSLDAYISIGDIYETGSGTQKNLSLAGSYYKQAALKGQPLAFGLMAGVFARTGQAKNCLKCWHLFFKALQQGDVPHSYFTDMRRIFFDSFIYETLIHGSERDRTLPLSERETQELLRIACNSIPNLRQYCEEEIQRYRQRPDCPPQLLKSMEKAVSALA